MGKSFDLENAEHSVMDDLGGNVYMSVEPVVFWIRDPIKCELSKRSC